MVRCSYDFSAEFMTLSLLISFSILIVLQWFIISEFFVESLLRWLCLQSQHQFVHIFGFLNRYLCLPLIWFSKMLIIRHVWQLGCENDVRKFPIQLEIIHGYNLIISKQLALSEQEHGRTPALVHLICITKQVVQKILIGQAVMCKLGAVMLEPTIQESFEQTLWRAIQPTVEFNMIVH